MIKAIIYIILLEIADTGREGFPVLLPIMLPEQIVDFGNSYACFHL
jgi:hypothetical protein